MKARIYELNGDVVAEYDDLFGERVARTFMAPSNGGYVREEINGEYRQVCDALSNRGSTLHLSDSSNLLDLIRREYRAMRREDAKYV